EDPDVRRRRRGRHLPLRRGAALRNAVSDHGEVAGGTGQAGAAVRGPPRAQARSGQEKDYVVTARPPTARLSPRSRMSEGKAIAQFGAEPAGMLDMAAAVAGGMLPPEPAVTTAARAAAPLLVQLPAAQLRDTLQKVIMGKSL